MQVKGRGKVVGGEGHADKGKRGFGEWGGEVGGRGGC